MKPNKNTIIRHCSITLLLLLSLTNTACSVAQIEEPAYSSLMREDSFEIREYAPRLVAQTRTTGTQKEAANSAFRVLADYIFGNNTRQSKIAMTSPVAQEKNTRENNSSQKIAMTAPVSQSRSDDDSTAEDSWLVQFTMPAEYTLDTLPQPNNPAVELTELPASRFVVLTFSGRANSGLVEKKSNELRAFVQEKQLKPLGDVVIAQYNPPWTLGPVRRNEVMIPIDATAP